MIIGNDKCITTFPTYRILNGVVNDIIFLEPNNTKYLVPS